MRFQIYRNNQVVEQRPKDRLCEQCGQAFVATTGLNRICSDACRKQRKNVKRRISPVVRDCKFCQTPFSTRVDRGGYKRLFCTRRCKRQYDSQQRQDVKVRQVTRLLSWQAQYASTCEICGFDRTVQRAHIVPVRDGGSHEKENILVLCPNHHWLFDHNKLDPAEYLRIAVRVEAVRKECVS